MHDRQGMIQRREAACPCAEAPALRTARINASAVFAGPGRDMLHQLHGPGIATTPVAYHVTPQDPIDHGRREWFCQEREMMTGRGDDEAKDILNPGGATLVEVAGRWAATRWIVPSFEAFHEDESPQMTGCARALASKHPRRSFILPPVPGRQRPPSTRRSAVLAGRYRCALVTQAFTAELDNAVF
jgi:hypothetical protein